jgi:hypothetical protein
MFGRYALVQQAMRIKIRRTCLLILCIVFLSFSAALAAEFALIAEPAGHQAVIHTQKADVKGLFKSAMRWRRVDLLKQLALADGIAQGDGLVLNLFPDTSYHATIDRVSVNVQGTITVRGRLRNYPFGYVLISTTGDLSLATIRVPELGVEYTIIYDPDSRAHYLLDNDPLTLDKLEDAPAVIPPPPKPEEQNEIKTLRERILLNQVIDDATASLDVMVVYTPAARVWADSNEGSISNVIAQAMEKAQLVADNSGTPFTIHMIHSAEVAYTESGDSATDLDRLRGLRDGYLDSVHTLRNTYGADLVVLFTKIDDTGGIGYLLDSPFGEPAYAFSITRVQQASWTYTTIHEIGHNMGLGHHKDQSVQPGPGLYSYSAGWRWVSTDSRRYCSVMTYEHGSYFADGMTNTRVPYFSNPSVTYIGAATGHATNGDNARTVREMKNVVAAYRQAQATPSCTYTISPTSALFSSSSNTGMVNVTTSSGGCSWNATSNALWITITAGGTGTGNGTVSYSLSANATGSNRTGTMTIGGATFTVTQNGDAGTTLYFPHVDTNVPWQTEIAIINTSSDQTITGTLKALNDEGQLIESKTVTLSARGRRQFTVSSEFANHRDIGYIIYEASSAAVQGYMKFTVEGTYRVAIPAVKEINTSDIYISHINSSTQWWTGVSLVNTTSATKELTITFNNGLSVPYTLNANQHRAFTIGSLLNQPLQPDIRSAVITNASGIIGLELFGSAVGSDQLDGLLLTDNTALTLYYPHVAGDVWRTSIVAYNPSASACTMTITPYSAQGTSLAPTAFSLAGKGTYIGLVTELGLPAQTAWFKIDSTRPLTGFEFFHTVDGNQLAAFAGGGGTGTKAGVFAKIEKNGWTGIAFVNAEDSAASVTLTAYNDNGSVVATRVLPVGGHAKVVNLAEAIFSQDIRNATYIAYSSDRNVVGFQINGTSDDRMLDGLPALADRN